MSARRSTGWPTSREPHAVFVDRSLGKRLLAGLRLMGFRPLHMGEVYEDDGKGIEDVRWIAEATERGYPIVSKDKKLWVNPAEVMIIRETRARVFVVGMGDVGSAAMGLILGRHILTVRRRMRRDGGCLWVLPALRQIDKRHDEPRGR